MFILDTAKDDFYDSLIAISQRANTQTEIEKSVAAILDDVKLHGDQALIRYAAQFDKAQFVSEKEFRVNLPTSKELYDRLSEKVREAISLAYENVYAFALLRKPKDWRGCSNVGAQIGEKFSPLDRVGVYIPGGTAPLISTIIHTAAIAQAAGVKEIVAITPPKLGLSISDEMAFAFHLCGVKEVYQLGGVYGIGALAYGTKTIKKVQKIVGPGNAWVTVAKKKVYGDVAIDMVAGPSEVMVLADEFGNPKFIAADLLSQLEHGGGNLSYLVTPSETLIKAVQAELPELLKRLSRVEQLKVGLETGAILIKTKNIAEAVQIANFVAPEHLELMVKNHQGVLSKINSAGAVFIGDYTPEPVGDYVAGASHVLPTNGSAKWFSGLSVESFFRRTSITRYSKNQFKSEVNEVATLAELEGLTAHALSATIRFEQEDN